ncbi:hypothetical protein H2198_000071 [Neophaeococcomyces mojaviensis]|uniref:Uncharacterized protein n=1 Tax=Neophaeococcomyces mojaviensis TaxID=3383035 RepID=A0ACC3AKX2_9EURO|nr:hypothetical protein H2198_000071 [Knufia sp. JES_112]
MGLILEICFEENETRYKAETYPALRALEMQTNAAAWSEPTLVFPESNLSTFLTNMWRYGNRVAERPKLENAAERAVFCEVQQFVSLLMILSHVWAVKVHVSGEEIVQALQSRAQVIRPSSNERETPSASQEDPQLEGLKKRRGVAIDFLEFLTWHMQKTYKEIMQQLDDLVENNPNISASKEARPYRVTRCCLKVMIHALETCEREGWKWFDHVDAAHSVIGELRDMLKSATACFRDQLGLYECYLAAVDNTIEIAASGQILPHRISIFARPHEESMSLNGRTSADQAVGLIDALFAKGLHAQSNDSTSNSFSSAAITTEVSPDLHQHALDGGATSTQPSTELQPNSNFDVPYPALPATSATTFSHEVSTAYLSETSSLRGQPKSLKRTASFDSSGNVNSHEFVSTKRPREDKSEDGLIDDQSMEVVPDATTADIYLPGGTQRPKRREIRHAQESYRQARGHGPLGSLYVNMQRGVRWVYERLVPAGMLTTRE